MLGKVPDNTPEIVNSPIQKELYEDMATRTQTEPIPTHPVTTQEEQHEILIDIATQTEDVPSYNMATQTDVWTSHNKEIQIEDILSHSINTQTCIQAKDIMTHNDPIILNLQEELAQARLALE